MADEEKLICFFDEQMSRQSPIETLIARTAEFVGRPVGTADRAGCALRAEPGRPCETRDAPEEAAIRRLRSGERVWVEHPGEASEVAVLLDLFSVAAKAALALSGGTGDDRRLRVALFSGHETERLAALKALGLTSTTPITVLGVAGPHSGRQRITEQVRAAATAVYTTPVGAALVVLARAPRDLDHLDVPVGVQVGISVRRPAAEVPAAFAEARSALRFTQPSTHSSGPYSREESALLHAEALGGYAVLAEAIPTEAIGRVEDVQALDRLIREDGLEMLRTLDIVVASKSLRNAARRLHTHHSSVAQRVERAARALGFQMEEPYGRNRLFLALLLRRLRDTAHLL